ncbi:hypothetical protein HZA33_04815 [Candidatus Pacearchaeota archaeon]|nr:hypothetical protein [Candidatus Pacearchaeota archaeon]
MQFLGNKEGKKVKRAQVTLIVIIAIVIVAAVVFILMYKPSVVTTPTSVTDPSSYIEKCARDSASEAINLLSKQGGLISPQNYILYDGQKVDYLCYTTEYYRGCVNQEPLLKQTVENEITKEIKPEIQKCVNDVVSNYQGKGYSVSAGSLNVETVLQPRKVLVNVNVPITLIKGETVRYTKFNAVLSHPLYNFIILSQEIVNSEARYGDYDQLSQMLLRPDISIDKTRVDLATIYILKDRRTGKQFEFAIKSYKSPGGLFG